MNISLVKVAVATLLFATAGASFAGPAVHPTTFDFSHMQSTGINLKVSGKLEFANAVLPQTTPVTAAKPITCTGGDLCSSNVDGKSFGGSLTYASGGITLVASATFLSPTAKKGSTPIAAAVMQDHVSGKVEVAGLGVYHTGNNSDDNVTAGETLKMSFSQVVQLKSVVMDSDGHTNTWTGSNAGKTFQYSTDDIHWQSASLTSGQIGFANLQSNTFYFSYGGLHPDQFYLGAMTVSAVSSIAAVPEPETYAMLLAGLGLIGAAVKRRKAKQA